MAGALILATSRPLVAQQSGHQHDSGPDSGFAALQERGKTAMGVDQYSSFHRFEDLADGGRIALQRDPGDTSSVRTIRDHLQKIARAFAVGDFSAPGFVHEGEVPGSALMRAKRDLVCYRFVPLPGGGEVRITTHDDQALKAVHEFLAFQRREHRVGAVP